MIPGGIFPTAILTNCRGYGLTGLALMVCLLACRPSESGRQKSGAGHAPPPEAGEEQTGNGQADAQPVQARDLQVVHHDGEGLVPEAGVLPVLINDQAVLVQPTGQYQTWYSASRRWGPVSLHDQAGAFRALYDIGGAGWFGLQADEISWFVAASGRAGRNRLAFDSPEAKLLGAGPDWIALLVEDHLNILQVAEERLRAWRLSEPWPGLRAVFPCSSGCAWLAWDGGGLFSTTALGEVWKPRQIGLNWPEEPLLALTMKAGLQEDRIVPEQILAVGESLDLYMLEPVETPDPEEFGWDQVADLSSDLCVPCHLDDGYQLRSTWTALKQTLLERLDPDRRDAKGAMPPAGTPWADQMTDEQRRQVRLWLETQSETDGPGGGGPGSDDPPDQPIRGDLKTLAEAHCLVCHSDATVESWWKSRKSDAVRRVESRDMPRGDRTLSPDQIRRLVDAVNNLE